MKTVICILSLIVGSAVAAPAADEPRVFTSSDGTEMVATIQSVIGETVMLQRSDGKVFNIPINRFSALDVEFINRWKVENKGKVPEHLKDKRPRLGLGVSTGETNKKDDQISGYVDEKKQKMNFKIEIENEDPSGKVLGEKTIPMTAARYLDAIGKLSAGDTFDNSYAKKGSESLSNSVKMTEK